ncbi:MAG: S9 family peptidase, partial [Candidatus Aminicenantes bacterium]|nr:S9 family peptidase [Candidatus Aminicenantes bacterium]
MSLKKTLLNGKTISLIVLVLSGFLYATDPSILTLGRIFSSKEFKAETFGPACWLKKTQAYTVLEDSQEMTPGQDIIGYDPESGKRKILVSAKRLIPAGKSLPLEIDDYQWSPGEKSLLIFTNSKRVWRHKTRGDYWILDLKNGKLRKLGGEAEESSLMFAKFSPRGDRIGYVCKNNIYVQNLNDMSITQLTFDGSKTTINGTFDWVYEEELDLRDGFRWSPDGRFIAFWQLDSSGVKEYYLINNTDSLYPKVTSIPYPKAGETNSTCRVGIINSSGGKIRWLYVPGDSRNHYITRMEWAANSTEVVFQHLNRLQNTNQVMLGDIHTGTVHPIFVDRDDTWVEVCDDFTWLDQGKRFIFVSERDGWKHVYAISRSGDKQEQITSGKFDIISIERIDEKNGWLYYIASVQNPAQRYLFRSRLNSSSDPERLTPLDKPGTHSYKISPDSKWAFHTHSSFENPETVDLVSLPSHRKVRTLTDNRTLKNKVESLKRYPVEFFRIDIGNGVLLDSWCMKPPDFNPLKKYPVLFYVYGEPWGQTVLDRWSRNYLWHLMLTQQGYLVMSVDNRGTAAPRGREWRHCIYGQVGILASADQAAALKAIIKKCPYVDDSRIGIWGWSGGGSMSLNMIFRYPDLYHTATAVAFVSNQRYYDTI